MEFCRRRRVLLSGLTLAQASLVLINYTFPAGHAAGKLYNLVCQAAACERCWHLHGCVVDAPNGA